MSLEQAILDRLEKRNEENARLQNIINDLERSADASSKQERETYDALVAYIQKMRAQIESDRLEREQMQHQITELRSERDRILEIGKGLVPKSALKQAVMEAAGLSSEVAKLRAEVPLESTREALKNAVAKLQEVTTEKDRMRLQLENARADLKQALVERDSLGSMAADRALEIRKLMDGHAEDMKAQAELTAQLDSAKGEAEEWIKQCHAARRQRDEVKAEARKETQRLGDECARLAGKVARAHDKGVTMGTIGTGQADGAEEQTSAADAGGDWRSRSFDIYLKDCGQLPMEIRVVNGRITQVDSFAGDLIGYPLKDCPREGEALVIGDLMGGTLHNPFGIEAPVLINAVVERKEDAAADGAAKEETAAAPEAEQPQSATYPRQTTMQQ